MANVHVMFILANGDTKRLKDGCLSDDDLELKNKDLLVWVSMDETKKTVKFPVKSPFTGLSRNIELPKGQPAKVSKVKDNAVPPHSKESFPYEVTVETLKARPLVGPEIIVDGGDGLKLGHKKKKLALKQVPRKQAR